MKYIELTAKFIVDLDNPEIDTEKIVESSDSELLDLFKEMLVTELYITGDDGFTLANISLERIEDAI